MGAPLFRSIFTTTPMKQYFLDRFGELQNVTWPTQKQAVHSMILVLVIMLIVGGMLSIMDYLLNQIVLWSLEAFKN
jgi:preprotein translocase SecE subunit